MGLESKPEGLKGGALRCPPQGAARVQGRGVPAVIMGRLCQRTLRINLFLPLTYVPHRLHPTLLHAVTKIAAEACKFKAYVCS